jgi:hypothetical protein
LACPSPATSPQPICMTQSARVDSLADWSSSCRG